MPLSPQTRQHMLFAQIWMNPFPIPVLQHLTERTYWLEDVVEESGGLTSKKFHAYNLLLVCDEGLLFGNLFHAFATARLTVSERPFRKLSHGFAVVLFLVHVEVVSMVDPRLYLVFVNEMANVADPAQMQGIWLADLLREEYLALKQRIVSTRLVSSFPVC